MRFLLPILFCLSAWAQPEPVWKKLLAVPTATGPFTPQSISGLEFWWVASDIKNTGATNASGHVTSWVDRIHGATLIGTTNLPWWSNTFIQCFKTNRLYPTTTITLKFINDATSTSEGLVVDDNQDSSNGSFIESTPNQRLIGLISGSPDTLDNKGLTVGARARNSPFDYLCSPYLTTTKQGTNGVIAVNANFTGTETVQDIGNFVGGKIYEIQIWTNTGAWTDTMRSNLHNYDTNTYGYAP